ncbi:MAG: hypothetical protein PVF05_12565 [Gemmatimonadales bacterium]|jgi:hypothetical protein
MNGLSRLAPVSLLVAVAAFGPAIAPEATKRSVDRWLVATAAAPDTMSRAERLDTDLLAAPGEQGVLPDRGRTVAGVTWRLVRRDGEAAIALDSLLPEVEPGGVVYAHAYLRLPTDRTLGIDWGGTGCTSARAWLNGRELERSPVSARLGAGWNTLLLKLVAGDCPLGLRATLTEPEADAAGAAGGERPHWAIDQIRVQASRPPGDVRTGPADWVVPRDTVRLAAIPQWRGDRLFAVLSVGLTSWGRAAVTDVRVELRDGPDGKAVAPWLVPGDAAEVEVPVRFDDVDALLAAGRVGVRLRWDDRDLDRVVRVAGERPGVDLGVRLAGWEVKRTAGLAETPRKAGRLPTGSGWILQGEWKVPKPLAGRKLAVETDGAPATYTLNGRPAPSGDRGVTLCDPCREGTKLELTATSTGPWTVLPLVRSSGASGDS